MEDRDRAWSALARWRNGPAIARTSPDRPRLVSWVLLIGVLNSATPNAIDMIVRDGWMMAAEQTFGVSMILVAAAAAGLVLAARARPAPMDAWDWPVLAIAALLLLPPVGAASLLALVVLASHLAWRDRDSPDAVAAATLFGGIGVMQLLLGPLLQIFAARLMTLDAFLVAQVLGGIVPGVTHDANLVDVPWGQSLIVDAECASVVPLLQTMLCWLTIVRLFRPAWRRADMIAVPFIVLPVVAANVLRMTVMGLGPESYAVVHGPVGVYAITIFCILVAAGAGRWTLAHDDPAPATGR